MIVITMQQYSFNRSSFFEGGNFCTICICGSFRASMHLVRSPSTCNHLTSLSVRFMQTSTTCNQRNEISFKSARANPGIIELHKRTIPNDNESSKSDRSNKANKSSIRWSPGSIAMLALPATAFALGCWQVQRLRWKLGLIDQLKSQLNIDAIPFPDDNLSLLSDLEYRRVRVTGEFLHDREFTIHPRGRFDEGFKEKSGGLVASSSVSSHGAHVITPFKLAKSGRIIMINRGWVPPEKISPKCRKDAQIKGEVTLDAIVRHSEKRPQFVSNNIPAQGIWYYKDFEAMAERYGTEPIYLEATYESTLPGGPIGGQTNISLRNEHLNYLITWYSLSALTLIMWYMKFCK
ncbi:SURF1-like protein [Toxocara canis]|uniref:SURF1-like protein n=1 Tax=Toxocara canis TaxID=6265 RepID=A0A0B2W1G6_TOXCA|nr:SURF1-like protein [Toxocara canis]